MTTAPSPRSRLRWGAAVVLVLAALSVSVVIGIVRTAAAPVEAVPRAPDPTGSAASEPAPADLYVHVHGEVANPGLYRVTAAARVIDVIAAAGGLTKKAEASAVNLARLVSDGEQLRAPAKGESVTPPEGAADPASPGEPGTKVNLNTADAATLETLPRIGPALAQRILEWREQNGRFTSVEDLLAVPGIGDKMLASLRDLVTV